MTILQNVSVTGVATYSEVFTRYCKLREKYGKNCISVAVQRPDNAKMTWSNDRLEYQRLYKMACDINMSMRIMPPDIISMFDSPRQDPDMRFGTIAAFHKDYNLNESDIERY